MRKDGADVDRQKMMAAAAARAKAAANASLPPIPEGHRVHPILARESLLNFAMATHPQYIPDPMHRLIAQKLTDVMNKKLKRLMIFAPPQSGKTELVSKRLPPFWFGHRGNDPIIMTSYSMDRSKENSEEARNTVDSEIYQAIFPHIRLREESKSKELWKLHGARGYLRAGGVASGITGLGAMLGIIDDPYPSWAAAQSETVRRATEEWYRGTFRTRIWEGGAIVLITTRWHPDDLPGWLMKNQPGEWEILRLPAIAETQDERDQFAEEHGLPLGVPDPVGRKPGEALTPSRFSIQELQRIRKEITEFFFQAEYQGRPTQPEGNVFKAKWFENKIVSLDNIPAAQYLRLVRYWDKAGTEGGGKFTAGVLVGADAHGNFYILDVQRGQWTAHKRNWIMKDTADDDHVYYDGRVDIWIEQEPGSGGKESSEVNVRDMDKYGARPDRVHEAKGVRVKPFVAKAEQGKVFLLEGGWNQAFLSELFNWSETATFKDQVEAASGAINKLILEDFDGTTDSSALMDALGWRGRPSRRHRSY